MESGAYQEREAKKIFRQLVGAIEYLHQVGVCHRDIKPSNILVSKENEVTLVDFNVARRRKAEGFFRMMTKTGTLAHSAPEIFTSTYYE